MGTFSLVVAALFFLTAHFNQKSEIVLLNNDKNSSIIIKSKENEIKLSQANSYIQMYNKINNTSNVKRFTNEELKKKYGDFIMKSIKKPETLIFYFTDGVILTEESKAKIDTLKKIILERQPCVIDVIGHSDRAGDNETNYKISFKRAVSLKNIIEKEKLPIVSINIKSFGENDPLIPTKDGVKEPKNRRVEVLIK